MFGLLKKISVLLLLFVAVSGKINAQWNLDYGFNLGAANYLGEIGGKEKDAQPFLLDLKLTQSRLSFGGFVRYKLIDDFSVKAQLSLFRIQGADSLSLNPTRVGRNLSFKNDIIELSVRGEYTFYKDFDVGNAGTYEVNMNMYLFGGLGVFYNNPQAFYDGKWYALQPLQTEGVLYSKIQPCAPIGLGLNYTFKRAHRFGIELGYRFTFTDFIDDVSGTYRDTAGLSPIQKVFVSRPKDNDILDNLPEHQNYEYPSPRGNPKNKDGYMTATISYSKVIKGSYRNKRFNASKKKYRYIYSKKKKRKKSAKF